MPNGGGLPGFHGQESYADIENAKAAHLLVGVMKYMSESPEFGRGQFTLLFNNVTGLRDWWVKKSSELEALKEEARALERKHTARAAALAKLTDEDRAALGIRDE